jgi:hypothetical protein
MKKRYIIQGYQVDEILPIEIKAAELTPEEIEDYSIEDFLSETESYEAYEREFLNS